MNSENNNKNRSRKRADVIFIILFAASAAMIVLLSAMSALLPTDGWGMWVSEIVRLLLLFGVPLVSLTWFVTSLVLFCRAPRGSELRRAWKHALVRSSVVFGTVAAVYIALGVLLMLAIRNM